MRRGGSSLSILALSAQILAQGDDSSLFERSLEELLSIRVVSASFEPQDPLTAAGTLYVVTAEQIERRGYRTLDELLEDMPGLDMVRVHGGFPTIRSMRGSYGDENRRYLLVIDGMVENNVVGSFELGGAPYTLEGVERVELLLGPAAVRFGAYAMTGIVHVITRKPSDADQVRYDRSFGSFATIVDQMVAQASRASWSISVAGSRTRSDGPRFEHRDPFFADAYVDEAYMLRVSAAHAGDRLVTTIGARVMQNPTGSGTWSNSPTALLGLPPQGDGNDPSAGCLQRPLVGEHPSRWNPYARTWFLRAATVEGDWELLLSQRESGLSQDSFSFCAIDDTTYYQRYAHDSYRSAVQLSHQQAWAGSTRLHVGATYQYDDAERGYRELIPGATIREIDGVTVVGLGSRFGERDANVERQFGLYGELNRGAGPVELTLGARGEHNSGWGWVLRPRAAAVWTPRRGLALRALYGESYRPPSNFERFGAASVAGVARLHNPDLKPESARVGELGLNWKHGPAFVQLSLFHQRLDDLIQQNRPLGSSVLMPQNVGHAVMIGAEFALLWDFSDWLHAFATASTVDGHTEQSGDEQDLPNIARYKGSNGLTIDLGELAALTATGRWTGERSVAPGSPFDSLPRTFRLDLQLTTARLGRAGVRVGAGVRNLFDADWADPGVRDGAGYFTSSLHEQPGRTAFVTLGFELD